MKKNLLILIWLVNFLNSFSQVNTFNKQFIYPFRYMSCCTYGQEFNNLNQTSDKGYITSRSVDDSVGSQGFIYDELIKTDKTGSPLWIKRILNGPWQATIQTGNNISPTSDDGYFVVTETFSDTTPTQIIAVKMDSLGNVLWSKKYPGEGKSIAFSGKQTADNGFIICGATTDANQKQYAYLFKVDSVGNYLWGKKCLRSNDTLAVFYTVTELPGNGYAAAGNSGEKAIIMKVDLNGNMLWNKGMFVYNSKFTSSISASDSSLIVCGTYYDSISLKQYICFAKFDQSGNNLWQKGYSNTSSFYNESNAWSLKETTDGFIYTGYIMDPIPGVLIGKLDLNANYQWCREYRQTLHPFSSTPLSVTTTLDSGIALGGYVGIFYQGQARYCTQLLKTDAVGIVDCDGINYTIPLSNLNFTIDNSLQLSFSGYDVACITEITEVEILDTTICETINNPMNLADLNSTNFDLSQNYPNPFSVTTEIGYTLTRRVTSVNFEMVNLVGKKVIDEIQNNKDVGEYSIHLNVSNLPKGMYFYSLIVDGRKITRKLIIE